MKIKLFGKLVILCCWIIPSSCGSQNIAAIDEKFITQIPVEATIEKTPTVKIQIDPTPLIETPTVQITRIHNILLYKESFVGNELGWHREGKYGLVVPGGEIVFFSPKQEDPGLPQSMFAV